MFQSPFHTPLLSRRSFLTALAGASFSQLLTGCGQANGSTLTVQPLLGAVPAQILSEFRKFLKQSGQSVTVTFSPEAQLQTLFLNLQAWQQTAQESAKASGSGGNWLQLGGDRAPSTVPDLVALGNYWLEKAIQQKLIQPIDPSQVEGWNQLPQNAQWKTLITRDAQGQPNLQGKIWGAPYRWGSTMIAYRRDIFQQRRLQPPTDWSDLWRSDLQQRLSLLDNAREVIGLTLKKLGQSYNTPDLSAVPQLQSQLDSLHQQVKLYSSDSYLQPLILGDTWLAVGWSGDILPLCKRNPKIAAVVPQSGTALWAELWVRPAGNATALSSPAAAWISFCWQSQIATQLSLLSLAAAPSILTLSPETLPPALRNHSLLLPDTQILQASEFLQPLAMATVEQYQTHWNRLRPVG